MTWNKLVSIDEEITKIGGEEEGKQTVSKIPLLDQTLMLQIGFGRR